MTSKRLFVLIGVADDEPLEQSDRRIQKKKLGFWGQEAAPGGRLEILLIYIHPNPPTRASPHL